MRKAKGGKLALAAAVSGVFLYLAFRNVALADLAEALSRVRTGWLLATIAVSFLIMVFRAWRWQLALLPLERVPLGLLWQVTAIAYMAINLLPVRLGEVVRPWLLSRRTSVSFPNVVGNIVLEKTLDSLVILFYILAGLLTVQNLPLWVRRGAIFPAAGAALLVVLVLLLWWRGEAFVDRWVVGRLPEGFGQKLRRVLASIVAGMRVLPNPRLLSAVFLVSLALWFLPILSSYLMILAFGLDVPFSAALVVFIFIGFGTALPNLPGMIGPYQYACQLALGLWGIGAADGLAYGLVLNAVQFFTLIAQGIAALPLAGVTIGEIKQARQP